jgi:hypothetical protein
VQNLAESDHNIPTSINALAKAFDCPPSRVKAALAHGLDDPGRRGKHTALDDDPDRQILDWVRQNTRYGKNTVLTYPRKISALTYGL